MAYINENYLKLKAGYIFPEIARRVKAFAADHPDAKIIRMGIGDVTEPLPMACIQAMHKAVDEMSTHAGFHGYGPEQGYDWLRQAVATHDYHSRNCDIAPEEIFVSDGSKCDCANILDIFATGVGGGGANGGGNIIAMTDPVYPVYVDSNVMHGNTGPADTHGEYSGLVYMRATAENNFTPELPKQKVDLIYLCYPNNPTGAVITRDRLTDWVNYAKENRAIIFYDSAYEAYISDPSLPRSIYEIPGSREVAIEFRSFSKTAGFTGTRCAYTVVPKSLIGKTKDGKDVPLHKLWNRRHSTKFNSVPYIIQRGALATYSDEGKQQIRTLINFYMTNAKILRAALSQAGLTCHGGQHAPYVWIKTPNDLTSWQFFDQLLIDSHIVSTPGSGFGSSGEGYIRLSAFNSRENVQEAVRRITGQNK